MEKLKNFELKKGWQWMLYLNLIFPALLFFGGVAFKNISLGVTMAKWFHSYGLYIINPIPNFSAFTGIAGFLYPLYFFYKAAAKKDWLDLVLCLVIWGATAVYFWQEWNYLLLRFLRLA